MNLKDILFMTRAHTIKPDAELFDILLAKKLDQGVIRTIKGNPLHFSARKAQKAQNPSLFMLPIQDLHGYDRPWVGGSGKNLLYLNSHKNNYRITPYGIEPSNYNTPQNYYIMQNVNGFAVGTYTVNDYAGDGSATTHRLRVYKNGESIGYASENKFTFTVDSVEDVISIRLYLYEGNTKSLLKPQIEVGSSTTSYEPYENICPISGRDSAEMTGCGKNLVIGTLANYYVSSQGIMTYDTRYDVAIAKVFSGKTYAISYDTPTYNAGFFTSYPTTTSTTYNNSRISGKEKTFVAPIDGYVAFRISSGYQYAQCEVDSTPTDYEAPNPQTVTFTFDNTVYGGTINLDTGVLSVTQKYIVLDGSDDEDWFQQPMQNKFRCRCLSVNEAKESKTGYVSSLYQFQGNGTQGSGTQTVNHAFYGQRAEGRIWIYDTNIADVTALKTMLTSTPMQVVVPLETPTTIQLTPQEINLLKGVNNVWTDGDTIELTYRA